MANEMSKARPARTRPAAGATPQPNAGPDVRFWVVLQGDRASVLEQFEAPDLTVKPGDRAKRVIAAYPTRAAADARAAQVNARARLPVAPEVK